MKFLGLFWTFTTEPSTFPRPRLAAQRPAPLRGAVAGGAVTGAVSGDGGGAGGAGGGGEDGGGGRAVQHRRDPRVGESMKAKAKSN